MSHYISYISGDSESYYVIIRKGLKIWNQINSIFDDSEDNALRPSYAVFLGEVPEGGGRHLVAFPSEITDIDYYELTIYRCIGSVPSVGDIPVATGQYYWNGTELLQCVSSTSRVGFLQSVECGPTSSLFSFYSGVSDISLILKAKIVDINGVIVEDNITTGFVSLGGGYYQWYYSSFPVGFRGSVIFIDSDTGSIVACGAIDLTLDASTTDGTTFIDHNYGGTDALRYLAPDNSPISGGIIQAFLEEDWLANRRASDHVRGETRTDVNGRWQRGMALFPGVYVLVFSKPDVFGPTTTTITVT